MRLCALLVALLWCTSAFAQTDIGSGLMRATFKIEGPGSTGTAFVVGRPTQSDPHRAWNVMVTAAHVLEHIKGDKAVLHCRKKKGNTYERSPVTIPIRKKGKALWTKHRKADVAVMYLPLPPDVDLYLIGTGTFITDNEIKKFEVHPGDRLLALGFPFGAEGNEFGFPILRSGSIASFPVTRAEGGDTFLFDFEVHRGNSGGPVFMYEENASYGGSMHVGGYHGIIGIVSQGKTINEKMHSLFETRSEQHPINVAVIVHASLIKEAIEMLPELEYTNTKGIQ